MNKYGLVKLVGYVTHICNYQLDDTHIQSIEHIVDASTEVKPNNADAAIIEDMLRAMMQGQKIEAIKAYRSLTGLGLRESKDAVERYWHPVSTAVAN